MQQTRPSPQETEILRLMRSGLSYDKIAARLHLSESTVERRVRDLMRRSGARSPFALGVLCVQLDWLPPLTVDG
ncbi:DNA-binding NarL/FixJ family response regulator [Allocatelliglobosispora scoriae]|uniref:DNA-binding NarL/FixJ family response regulator n=1 Tax=Allocatelliglobosispora scoriae TaxID=643052 RepID=A0A841BM76_9ACTN|nr:helix-turn-helix transcriptional regulator [Allocatelliglobosispora scoriae]MBB5868765.1 DNA-binding NarL/FixJ family response regulator [Allocatelliglobosispora scoriae]